MEKYMYWIHFFCFIWDGEEKMDNWLKPYIEKLQNIFEIKEYDQFVTVKLAGVATSGQ